MFSKRFSLIFTKAIFIFPRLCHKLKTKNKDHHRHPFVRRKKRGRERRDCTQKHSFNILIPAKVSRLPRSRQPQLEPKVCKCLTSHSLGCDGPYSYSSCYHLTGQKIDAILSFSWQDLLLPAEKDKNLILTKRSVLKKVNLKNRLLLQNLFHK